jgi:hypothetical protein
VEEELITNLGGCEVGLSNEVFKQYEDKYGLIHWCPVGADRAPSSGNGILTTCITYALLSLRKELDPITRMGVKQALKSCQVMPGLYRRSPENLQDYEAMDDYSGLALFAAIGDRPILAAEVLEYGEAQGFPCYVYNNVVPGKWYSKVWLGRFPTVVANLEMAANRVPPVWRRLWWAGSLVYASFSKSTDQDAWMMGWISAQCYRSRLPDKRNYQGEKLMGWVVQLWWDAYEKKVPKGLGSIYIKDPNHPITQLWCDFESV